MNHRECSLTSGSAFKQGCISKKYHIKKALMFWGTAAQNNAYQRTENTCMIELFHNKQTEIVAYIVSTILGFKSICIISKTK